MGTVNIGNGSNLVRSVKTAGTDGAQTSAQARTQQTLKVATQVANTPKGSNLQITVTNGHATNTEAFIMLDPLGIAAASGASATGADITFTTTFAGGVSHAILKNYIIGSRLASLGMMIQFSAESFINSSALKIWNGNLEDYNSKSISSYLQLAKDTYANDPKILVLDSEFYLNPYFAISGSIPALSNITFLFNVPGIQNF